MLKLSQSGRAHAPGLVADSPLRRLDPRTRLGLSLCASLAVMLPLERLALFLALAAAFCAWARILPAAARQAWRLKWLLVVIFIVDLWLVDLELAAAITLRLVVLAVTFTLFFAVTTAHELGLALEGLRLPYRYAFSLSLALQSLSLLDDEWRAIVEAQAVRGALPTGKGLRGLAARVGDLVALTVPAILLTTRRAWALTEAAYTRGFDAPTRRPYQRLAFTWRDALAAAAAAGVLVLFYWKF